VSEEVNRKLPTVQPSTATLSTVLHSVTDGRTDRLHYDAKSRSYC